LPVCVCTGENLMITRRCTQRQFLLRPSSAVNGIIGYCLAVAAERYGLRLRVACVARGGPDPMATPDPKRSGESIRPNHGRRSSAGP